MNKYTKYQDKLMSAFNLLANNPVNGCGVGSDKSGNFIQVYLERPATSAEKILMPGQIDNIPVKYSVIGEIKPL